MMSQNQLFLHPSAPSQTLPQLQEPAHKPAEPHAVHHVGLKFKDPLDDAVAARVAAAGVRSGLLPLETRCTQLRVFSCLCPPSEGQVLKQRASRLHDIHEEPLFWSAENPCPQDPLGSPWAGSWVVVSWLPGVTDDEAYQAQRVLWDQREPGIQRVFTHKVYLLSHRVEASILKDWAHGFLGNPMVSHFEFGTGPLVLRYQPAWSTDTVTLEQRINESLTPIVLQLSPNELAEMSQKNVWALSVEEMVAIREHFLKQGSLEKRMQLGLPLSPTKCEMEVIAQTWSEHCKHKEFNGIIHFTNHENGTHKIVDSLFKTYIKASTSLIQKKLNQGGQDWLVKVFDDNAGLVKVNPKALLAWKVETHNSPSALDPYGGSLTGILGCHRDALGTGIGGARLFFNTNVLCFGPPDAPAQSHLSPARVMQGVVHGVADGGNKSGVPTVNGSVVFNERFSGKPLVFCGSAALLPIPSGLSVEQVATKVMAPGDLIVMAGGRVGRDGIHGATFSSVELDDHSPLSAVQIGSPWTQKILGDFLHDALQNRLLTCTTDNGAGGLSSSVGELARLTGGARIDLNKVPLKYPGLSPWEIMVSESQERMTLAVPEKNIQALSACAQRHGVELSVIGEFTNHGYLTATFAEKIVAHIDLDFLHDGVPRKTLTAQWTPPRLHNVTVTQEPDQLGMCLKKVLSHWNVCSRRPIIQRYDTEVQCRTLLKPLMGMEQSSPQDAAVMRISHDPRDHSGCAVSNGLWPQTADLDPYHSSAMALDEAVRQIIAVGGRLPEVWPPSPPHPAGPALQPQNWWTLNDNFCCPNSVYDEKTNADGHQKLGQLVRMCEALFDGTLAFGVPLTSGKDSMKNDFQGKDTKISIPPTVLYSAIAHIPDVRRITGSTFNRPNDFVYILGATFEEWGGSVALPFLGHPKEGGVPPRVDFQRAKGLYTALSNAQALGLVSSCHDLSEGGLAVALAESCFGSGLGVKVNLNQVHSHCAVALFCESASRFIVSIRPEKSELFEEIMKEQICIKMGVVTLDKRYSIEFGQSTVMDFSVEELYGLWTSPLEEYV